MEFRVLGPVEVSSANGPIQLGPPKQRALLAALLARANQVVSLDRLIDDLWGSEPPPAATGSLQAYIANLRRVLEPERSPRTPAQILRSLAPGYQLRVGPGQLDAGTFETGLREGRSRLADGAPGEALAALRAALQLWRGPAFADVAHWDFLAPEVARLAELRLVGQESYAEAALALNRAAEMVPYLQRLVTEAPLREHLRELLVLALYRSGRQADALQVIAEARRLFIAELGITPGPALASLQSAILAHDPRLDAPPALAHPNRTATGIRAPSGADDHAQRSPFVGREQPLQVARNVLDAASSGHGSLLMLMGEPGIGKTRLAEEVAALAAGRGFGLGWGRCPDNEGVPAFWPWIQIMRDLTGVLGPHRFDAAVNHTGPHLTPLLPTPDGSPADATPSSRFLACDAAVRLLKRLAREQPLLLVLDDVHWADAPTAELAGYLAGQLTSVPIVVILTFRDSEVSDEGPVPALMAKVAREPGVERISLGGLNAAEVGRLIEHRTGQPVAAPVAEAVHARTEGNPFFASEMTRLLVSEHRLTDAASSDLGVPDTVRDVVRRRIKRLPEQTITLLAVAAVIGPEFDLDVLEQVSGLDLDAIAAAVEVPVLTALVVEDSARPGRYRFGHALIRETLYTGLAGPRRNRLHARTAEALAALGREDETEALAHHAWRAGPALPPLSALELTMAGADHAERDFAYEQAVEHFERALRIIDRLPAGSARDKHALVVLCRLARLLGDTRGQAAPRVAEAYERARRLARELGRPAEYGEAVWGLWANRLIRAAYAEADAIAAELMVLAEQTQATGLLIAARHALGAVAFQRGDYAVADEQLSAAITLGEEHFVEQAEAQESLTDGGVILGLSLTVSSYAVLAMVRFQLGRSSEAVDLRDTGLRLARRLDRPVVRAYALFVAAQLAVLARDLAGVRRFAAEAIDLSRRYGFQLWGAVAEIYDAWAESMSGGAGAPRIDQALDEVAATGDRMLRTLLLGLRAEAHLRAGNGELARRTVAEALAEQQATGERLYAERLAELQRQTS